MELTLVDFSWKPENLVFVIAITWTSLGFASYFFLARNKRLSHKIWTFHPRFDTQAREVLIQRIWGFLFLGLGPLLFIALWPGLTWTDYGLGFSFLARPPWWIGAVAVFIIVAGSFAAAKPANLAVYPQIRSTQWTPGLVTISGLTWVAFLLGYEILFRGFLLFASLEIMDVWAAIALNCTIYAFAHFYKGPGETFGSLPFGILFCYLTLRSGNIWSAVLLHCIMALSNEWWSIRSQADMHIVKKESKLDGYH